MKMIIQNESYTLKTYSACKNIEYRREKSLQVQGMQCDYGLGCKWNVRDISSCVA